jgi:hypothetical protein
MVMVSGGSTNVTLSFPKNDMSAPGAVGEVYVVPPNVFVFIVIVRFAEVFKKASVSIEVTESGMFMDVKIEHPLKALLPIDVTKLGIVNDAILLQPKKA